MLGSAHIWKTASNGQRVRHKKEKTLGPTTKPKHEALKELGEYIAEHGQTKTRLIRHSGVHLKVASVEDMHRHFCIPDPQTKLKHHAKVIPESLRAAVAALNAKITGAADPSRK